MFPGFDWSKIQDPTANYNVSAGLSPIAKFIGQLLGKTLYPRTYGKPPAVNPYDAIPTQLPNRESINKAREVFGFGTPTPTPGVSGGKPLQSLVPRPRPKSLTRPRPTTPPKKTKAPVRSSYRPPVRPPGSRGGY